MSFKMYTSKKVDSLISTFMKKHAAAERTCGIQLSNIILTYIHNNSYMNTSPHITISDDMHVTLICAAHMLVLKCNHTVPGGQTDVLSEHLQVSTDYFGGLKTCERELIFFTDAVRRSTRFKSATGIVSAGARCLQTRCSYLK